MSFFKLLVFLFMANVVLKIVRTMFGRLTEIRHPSQENASVTVDMQACPKCGTYSDQPCNCAV